MTAKRQLTPSQRTFFDRISTSTFENPFSQSRLDADRSAVGATGEMDLEELLTRLLATLDEKLQTVAAGKAINLREYGEADRARLQISLLFSSFHRQRELIDAYIRDQIRGGDTPITAPWADHLFRDLTSYGIDPHYAATCVAIFFQFRRAYYFISTSLLGNAPSMRRLREQLWNAIFTCDTRLYVDSLWTKMEDFSTLLLGETGTGKGAAAMALGRSGFIPYLPEKHTFQESFTKAFLSINLSQFSENLIESELFGHRKGAFTGAVENHDGIFTRCSRYGAIFLDEIGEVSEPIQIKLLQVLQQRTFSPVGGHEVLRFEGRVIAATNRDLAEQRGNGRFRNDFYYRLSSGCIELPTLRQRIDENPKELELLVADIVKRLTGEDKGRLADRISVALKTDILRNYTWPGNVRELEQAARSVLLTGHYFGDPYLPAQPADDGAKKCLAGRMTLDELTRWYCGRLYSELGAYGPVAERLGVDWRTAKRLLQSDHPDTTP